MQNSGHFANENKFNPFNKKKERKNRTKKLPNKRNNKNNSKIDKQNRRKFLLNIEYEELSFDEEAVTLDELKSMYEKEYLNTFNYSNSQFQLLFKYQR